MSPSEGERLCQEALVHYYDLLTQDEGAVPAAVRRHVATCTMCQDRLRRLRETLFESERPPDSVGAQQDETIEALAQQFQLLDERVTCSEAKPLLPELVLPAPRITIPTPVTVHVDHCPQCARDLAAIRGLHLSSDQLKRLGRLLESARGGRLPGIRDSFASAACGSLCREGTDIACDDVALSDLFEAVVPEDAPASGAGTVSARQRAVTRHVRSCPACLGRVRAVEHTIAGIAARADSEIATVYHAGNDAAEASGETEGEYPYPVSVEVLQSQSEGALDSCDGRAASPSGLGRLVRSAGPLVAVAALVLVATILGSLLGTTASTASGTNVGDVDKALAKMKSVHILTRDWNAEPLQEYWIARSSNILVSKTKEDCVLYDLARDRKTILELQTGSRASARLNQVERDGVRQLMASCLRDLVAEVSSAAELRRVTGQTDSGAEKGLDVYELSSPPRAKNSSARVRRLVYLEPTTGLPRRMEYYRQGPGARGTGLVNTTTFAYPTEQEMRDTIRALFPAE